jgi:competence ComEA-like helix-hairpin-helix protein
MYFFNVYPIISRPLFYENCNSSSIPYDKTSNGLITETLAKSKQRIDFALFVFSDQEIANQLNLQQKYNVNIRGIIDPNFAYTNYSKTLDMWGIAIADKNCKSKQIPWQSPLTKVGVPQIAASDKMHHKFALIDNNTVITGSHNWTEAGNYRNDENLLVIKSPIVAAHFEREMERLLKGARFNPNKVLLARAKQSLSRCGTLTAQKVGNINEPIRLNTASIDELDKLPGIGKSLAERIVDARPINSWEDLEEIKGMTKARIEKIRDKVTF